MSKTKLARAFKELRKAGIYARMNFSCCGGCGCSEIHAILKAMAAKGKKVYGYCFYHAQENERLEHGADSLYLQFGWFGEVGPVAPGPYIDENVGHKIVEILGENGFKCDWNGSGTACIRVIL